ncbi:hypothetical protein C0J52_27860 [Blattella germanica]|nr:hypothetical protein C0J52_27860 [Blattella germanica]
MSTEVLVALGLVFYAMFVAFLVVSWEAVIESKDIAMRPFIRYFIMFYMVGIATMIVSPIYFRMIDAPEPEEMTEIFNKLREQDEL